MVALTASHWPPPRSLAMGTRRLSYPCPAAPPQISVGKAHATDADALALVQKPEPQAVVVDVDGVDFNLNAATAEFSRETSGIGAEKTEGAYLDLDQGQVVGQKGPDGGCVS
jgi:hypothetical protein